MALSVPQTVPWFLARLCCLRWT